MARPRGSMRRWVLAGGLAGALAAVRPATAIECTLLLGLFQQGASDAEIASVTGASLSVVNECRRELRRPVFVGPTGLPPVGAAGAPPAGAAGPPPVGAAGRPPAGAAGPPPVGRELRRLP